MNILGCLILVIFAKDSFELCDRPNKLLAAEDICWTEKVQIAERVQYATKSVLNFAKKKLGIGEQDEIKPQKCDYYQCIFQEMKLLNTNNYPNYDKIVKYIDDNVIYNRAKIIFDRLTECNEELASATTDNKYFDGNLSNSTTAEEYSEFQSTCEMLAEFMKCIALAEPNSECPIFMFP